MDPDPHLDPDDDHDPHMGPNRDPERHLDPGLDPDPHQDPDEDPDPHLDSGDKKGSCFNPDIEFMEKNGFLFMAPCEGFWSYYVGD